VENCTVNPYFSCYSKAELKRSIKPEQRCDAEKDPPSDWRELNSQAYTDKMSPDFQRTKCAPSKGCNNPSYLSMDPRLFSSTRADYLPLDRPPINGNVQLKDVYSDSFENYGIGYKQYKDINDGQIVYYTDKSIAPAFYKPVYSEPADEIISLYQDPMGAMKTVADRRPIINTNNPMVSKAKFYPYCLSDIQDSQSFREDIMALQQRKNNQSKWTVRWGTE